MVTKLSILFNALWIVGLAGLLATISYADWLRKLRGWSWKQTFALPGFEVSFNLSLALTSLGIALSGWYGTPSQPLWQTMLWIVLVILFVIQCIGNARLGRKYGWDGVPSEQCVPPEQ